MLTPNQIPVVTVPAEPSSMLVILLKIRNQTAEAISQLRCLGNSCRDEDRGDRVKYWEIFADNVKKAGRNSACISSTDDNGRHDFFSFSANPAAQGQGVPDGGSARRPAGYRTGRDRVHTRKVRLRA